jgi:hypothetical protein
MMAFSLSLSLPPSLPLSLSHVTIYVRLCSPEGSFYFIMVEVLGFCGGMLNATRCPERIWPGTFDFWFNSHQVIILCTLFPEYAFCVVKTICALERVHSHLCTFTSILRTKIIM